MNILVTGGGGFIGSHLVDVLCDEGHTLRVLDNFFTGKRENIQHHLQEIELIEGDIRDYQTCVRACRDVECVWHLAAVGSVPRSIADPLLTHDTNITGTLHMLMAAREAGVRRFVYASSSSVYGANPELPRVESQHPMPVSPYANSKMAGETYVRQFAWLYGLETVVLRYFNVYGPRQHPDSLYAAVVPRFFAALLSGQHPAIYGDGAQSREFTYVADCVQGNLLAGFSDSRAVIGEHFNIAAGSPATVNALLAAIQQALDTMVDAHYLPERPGDVRYSDASIAKAASLLQFAPRWALDDGIRETATWFMRHHAGAATGSDAHD